MDLRYISMFCLLSGLLPSTLLTNLHKMHMMCLEQRTYEWDMRAAVKCGRVELYHCLQHINNTKIFYEFCQNFTYISPGKYPVYNPRSKAIYEKPCPNNTYQGRLLKSSELNSCLVKTDCTGIGSLVCSNGSPSEDRRCKCDITIGMVILSYGDKPNNTNICCPHNDPACMCWSKHCQKERELNEIYQCVPKCKPGFHRPNWTSDCISSGSTNSNTTIDIYPLYSQTLTTDNVGITDSGTTTSIPGMDMTMMMSIITIEVIFFILIAIVVLLVVNCYCQYKNRRKRTNNPTDVVSIPEEHVLKIKNNYGDVYTKGDVSLFIEGDNKGDTYNVKGSKNLAIGKKPTFTAEVIHGHIDEKTNLQRNPNTLNTEVKRLSSNDDSEETCVKHVESESDEEEAFLLRDSSLTEPKSLSSLSDSIETGIKCATSESEC